MLDVQAIQCIEEHNVSEDFSRKTAVLVIVDSGKVCEHGDEEKRRQCEEHDSNDSKNDPEMLLELNFILEVVGLSYSLSTNLSHGEITRLQRLTK